MLYNGSEVIRDLEWVIFDEVHYINDAEVRELLSRTSFHSYRWRRCFYLSLFLRFSWSERSCVGGGADYASGSRQYHSSQRHGAERSGVQ